MKSKNRRHSWLRARRRRRHKATRQHTRLRLESLEDRLLLTTFNVNSVDDLPINPNDGLVTFREAVIEANSNAGADLITVPAGTYSLSIPGSGEGAAATGDVDITDDVTIIGAGAGQTIIDATGLTDRVFHVVQSGPEPLRVTLGGVTIAGGSDVDRGAGLFNRGGTVTVQDSEITGNDAVVEGAPFYNEVSAPLDNTVDGLVRLINTPMTNNSVGGQGSQQLFRGLETLLRDTTDEVVDEINGFMDSLTGQLRAAFTSIEIPVIGDQVVDGLQPMFDTLDQFRTDTVDFIDAVLRLPAATDGPALPEIFQNALFLVLCPGDAGFDQLDPTIRDLLLPLRQGISGFGLNVLRDGPDLGAVLDPSDITVTVGEDNQGKRWLEFGLRLGQNVIVDVPEFDMGLSSLVEFLPGDNNVGFDLDSFLSRFGFNLTAANGLRFNARWDLRLGFGISEIPSQSFYFNSGATVNGRPDGSAIPELNASVFVIAPSDGNTPGLSGNVNLGVLRTNITDGTAPDIRITAPVGLPLNPLGIFTSDISGDFDIVVERDSAPTVTERITYQSFAGDNLATFLFQLKR